MPLKGSIAKTHLMTFMQCLKSERMFWNDTKQKMLCPAGQHLLREHISHGMFYEVFKWSAVKEDRAALEALCKSDNLDSAFALGETELQLLEAIHLSLDIVRPPAGKTRWDMVRVLAMEQCGQRWSEEDIVCMYNFSKVIGEPHLQFLVEAVAIHVPWDDLAVRPGDFHSAAKVHASLPWLKVALITAQYFPPEGKVEQAGSGRTFGDLITKDQWAKLAKASPSPESPLGKAEAFLSYLVSHYLHASEVTQEKVALEIPAAFARTVKAVLLSKEIDKDPIDITKVEAKLRERLVPATLPPPFSPLEVEGEVAKPKKSSAATPVQPDT